MRHDEKLKILFMGTPEYAAVILNALLEDAAFEVTAVVTQPDKPVGRNKTVTPPPVKQVAVERGIDVWQPQSLKNDAIVASIRHSWPDYIVVAAYGQLLPKSVLEIAPCINLHASLLPMYRGASPIQQALLQGDTRSGVTAMLMEEGLDSGPTLACRVADISKEMRKEALFSLLAQAAATLTLSVLKRFASLVPGIQPRVDATYCQKILKHHGKIDWSMPAETIHNCFRAYEGWPGVSLDSGLKLLEVALHPGIEGQAGKIVAVEGEACIVACGAGGLCIGRLQPPSKKAMDAASYLRGKRLGVGDYLA